MSGGWRRAVLAAFAGDWRNAVQAWKAFRLNLIVSWIEH